MAARIICRKTPSFRNPALGGAVRLKMYSLSCAEHKAYVGHVLIQSPALVGQRQRGITREYADAANAKASGRAKWTFYKYLILVGVPGGLVFYVSLLAVVTKDYVIYVKEH